MFIYILYFFSCLAALTNLNEETSFSESSFSLNSSSIKTSSEPQGQFPISPLTGSTGKPVFSTAVEIADLEEEDQIDDTESAGLLNSAVDAEQSCPSDAHSHGAGGDCCNSPPSQFSPEDQAKIDAYIAEKKAENERQIKANDEELAQKTAENTLTGALFRKNLGELSRMLASGRNPNELDQSGEHTALHHAAYRSEIAFATELLKAGANPNTPNFRGETPLMWACKMNYLPMVHLIVSHGGDLTTRDSSGLLAIHHAADAGHTLIIDFLMLHGCDINTLDSLNKSCLMWASYSNHDMLVLWLLQQGADPEFVDTDGYTFIHWAASQAHIGLLTKVFDEFPHLAKLGLLVTSRNKNAIETAESKAEAFPVAIMGRQHRNCGMLISSRISAHKRSRESCCGFFGKLGDLVKFLRGPLVIFWVTFLTLGVTLTMGYLWKGTSNFPVFNIIFVVAFIFSMYNWIKILFGEPAGLNPEATKLEGHATFEELNEKYLEKLRSGTIVYESHCTTCRIIRPLRAKHCNACKRCVLKFDHHCPFLDQDIALGNYHNFLLFIVGQFVLIGNFIGHVWYYLMTFKYEDGTSVPFSVVFNMQPIVTVLMIHYAIYILLPIGLMIQHFTLVVQNLTTNEEINRRYPYFWLKGTFFNPFSEGKWNNILYSFRLKDQPDYLTIEELIEAIPDAAPPAVPEAVPAMNDNNAPTNWFSKDFIENNTASNMLNNV